ncbi:LacI family DNA-binding transcriptional regulator [Bifidobacterium xylocopae]|nr:LacI family DNA-binding transcriptional regulator [Bifidobacterium xylocopae]
MTDIAREAKVSPATVSRALNGHPTVSDKVRRSVLDAAERLGYVRNLGAVSLASSQSNTVGLLIRDAGNQFYGGLASRIQAETDRYGFDLLITAGGDTLESQERAVRNLLGHGVGGIVIASGRVAAEAAEYSARFVPSLVLGTGLELPSLSSVRIDPHMEAGLARRVVDHGHRSIAVTASEDPLASTLHARTANFLTELVVAKTDTYIVSFSEQGGVDELGRQVDRALADGVTAIMAGSDEMALQILEYLNISGLRCPQDVSVTGFDGIGAYRSSLLGLTTIEQPVDELAHAAIKLMSRHMNEEHAQTAQILVPGRFVKGRTLGMAQTSD